MSRGISAVSTPFLRFAPALGSSSRRAQGPYASLFGGDPAGRLRLTAGSQVAIPSAKALSETRGPRHLATPAATRLFGAPCRLMDFSHGQMLPAGGICDAWKNSLEGAVGYCGVGASILRVLGVGNIRRRAIAFQGQG